MSVMANPGSVDDLGAMVSQLEQAEKENAAAVAETLRRRKEAPLEVEEEDSSEQVLDEPQVAAVSVLNPFGEETLVVVDEEDVATELEYNAPQNQRPSLQKKK
ncbi:hypothetical protein BCR33DRAFT_582825 [Rhizoclosmatium globosum]|uniref:Uncharacterized protein n=1 Tax=Rhizoclosmatium globosum TaxID=329046 RepID=A0A1Y2CSS8_9FUNG|nr:hypothetical protein BCR33DRAFT_582825 [Rhizoclosmatium globosum]|eukprot:ORY49435.1 hypothetical protein BCR33DRAFT_582825 [Rhizoclosmatium globosum]